MMHHLRPDLDQFLAQRGKRPVLHAGGQRQAAEEVAQVVRQREQLQPDLVVVAFIADDLNRSRFWQETRQVAGESRLVTSLKPGGPEWIALGEMFEPRIDEEWCQRVVGEGAADDLSLIHI